MKLSLLFFSITPLLHGLAGVGQAQVLSPSVPAIQVFSKETRIQGDSITDGNRGRSADPNHILGHGYVFITAAKYGAAFAALNLEFSNRGISGNTVLDLQKRWAKDTLGAETGRAEYPDRSQ